MRQPAASDPPSCTTRPPPACKRCQEYHAPGLSDARAALHPARRRKPPTGTSQNEWSCGCQPDDPLPDRVSRATCDGLPCTTTRRCAVFMRGGAARPKIYTTYTPSIVAKPAYVNRFDCLYRIHARFALARVAARQGYSWRHHGRVSSHLSKSTCTITRVRDLGLPSMSAPPCQKIAQSGLFETSLWTSRGTPPRSPADLGELRSAGRTGRPSLPGFMVYQLLRVQ
jgi:hypothetical protein